MNSLEFIPARLKEARLLLGLTQGELGALVHMQQKDLSLHENKTTKTLIPLRYMLVLHQKGIDLNSLMDEGPVRMRTAYSARVEQLHAAAAPPPKLQAATAAKEKLLSKLLTPERIAALIRLAEKEERGA